MGKLCTLCPRKCSVDRSITHGVCGANDKIKVARVMLHMWEEPPVSGVNGSGAIFFSHCPLKCVYCQNKEISHGGKGKEITVLELSQYMLRLQEKGAHNINLVTPTHYGEQIRQAIDLIRDKLKIPVVYNTSGYELDTEIHKMRGYVDVFLTDFKYFSPEFSKKYSSAEDYYEVAKKALMAMLEIAPSVELDGDGIIKSGVIIRHLVLPSLRKDSINLLNDLKNSIDVSRVKLSLMAQYTPDLVDEKYKEIKRSVTSFEYNSVVETALSLGFDGYIQDKSSVGIKFTPEFFDDFSDIE